MKKIRWKSVKIKYVLTDKKMPDAMEPIEFKSKPEAFAHIFTEEYGLKAYERKDKKITLNKLLKLCGYSLKRVIERVPA